MKKLREILLPLAFTLAIAGCNYKYEARNRYQNIKDLTKIVWGSDTLDKNNSNKSIYEKFLPDSILYSNEEMDSTGKTKFVTAQELEMKYLNLKNARLKHYNNFLKTKNKDEALKAIAYSQYLAITFPGNDGNELEQSAEFIEDITNKLNN